MLVPVVTPVTDATPVALIAPIVLLPPLAYPALPPSSPMLLSATPADTVTVAPIALAVTGEASPKVLLGSTVALALPIRLPIVAVPAMALNPWA